MCCYVLLQMIAVALVLSEEFDSNKTHFYDFTSVLCYFMFYIYLFLIYYSKLNFRKLNLCARNLLMRENKCAFQVYLSFCFSIVNISCSTLAFYS